MIPELAIAIRSRRLKLGLSEGQLCRKLGIETSMLVAIETGRVDPDVQLLQHTARELSWSLAALMSSAEVISDMGEQRSHLLHLALNSRRQMDILESQHERLKIQLCALRRQAEALKECRVLINSLTKTSSALKTSTALTSPTTKSSPVVSSNVEHMDERLTRQEQSVGRIVEKFALKKAQSQQIHDRFIKKFQSRRLSLVSSQ